MEGLEGFKHPLTAPGALQVLQVDGFVGTPAQHLTLLTHVWAFQDICFPHLPLL